MFATTGNFGKLINNNNIGISKDWATYFTMSNHEDRGWIFRRGSVNVAGVDGNGAFVTAVNTGTHINGLQGKSVAINMTSGAGYLMLARIKSSNGRFNLGVYNRCLIAVYGADSITTNTYSHGICILAENGVTSLKYLRVDGANHIEEAFDMAGYIARFHGKTWVYGPLHIGRDDATANSGYASANVGINNYIAFYGVYGDNPGGFNHTYIGERIYGAKNAANEQSELLLFHGNDPASSSGPDRTRVFSGAFQVDIFTAATSGTWMDVGNSANAIRGFYVHGTDGVVLGNTTARSMGVNQTTINGHLVINGAYNTNNSYSEGIRVNKSSNNWSVIQMGGANGSTTGTGDGQYLFGVNPSGNAFWSHNGSDSATDRIQGHKSNGWSIRRYLYINKDSANGYNFYVNGTSYFSGNVWMAATTESTSSTTGTLRVDGGVGIGKDLNARSLSRNGDNYVLAPGGGYFTTTQSSYTGALKITMPVSWTNTMMDFFVDIYDYSSQKLATYHIGGYNYASSASWINTSAYSNGVGDKSNLIVRFCHDGSKCCVTIGNIDTVWSYPQITVRGFSAKYSGTELSKWENGWSISFIRTLPTVKSTIENPAQIRTDTANRVAFYYTATHVKSAPNLYTDGSTYLAIINNNTNNSYDSLLYIEGQTSNDWGIKLVKNTANYGLYIQATGNEQLRVGTNSIFVVHQKSIYLRPNNTEQMLVDENHTRVIARQAASNPYGGSGLEIREVGAVGTAQSSLAYAPKLGMHWGSRYSAFIALHEHVFKFMADGGGSARPIYVGSIGSSWIDGHKRTDRAGITIANINNTGSYWPWIQATNTGSGRLFGFGNLNTNVYLMSSATSRTANSYERSLIWSGSDGHLWIEGGNYHQMIQLNTAKAECSIAYNGGSGTNWVVGKNSSNFGWWNGSYWVMSLEPVGRLWVGRNSNDGERQIGVNHATSGTIYLWANNGEKGIYSGALYSTGYVIRITNLGKFFYGAMAPTGFANGSNMPNSCCFTYNATSGSFAGNSGWCHYLISNHGDGSSYYHYILGLPFWGPPIYRRLEGGTAKGWYTFITTENASTLWWANVRCSTSSNTGTQPTFNTCYTSNWFRSTGATGWYSESYGGGIWMQDSTYVRVYNNKHFWIGANLYVSQNNTTGNGIYLADDGSIVDNNDGFCTMRFTYGVYITAGKNNNTVRMGLRYDGWIYMYNGGNGIYWPNCNGAHLYANSGQGSYGALVTQGARNGYNGLHLGNNGNYMTLMDNSNDKGLFQQGKRWIIWYNRGSDCICIGNSNYSGWRINLADNTYCYGAFYSGDIRGGRVRLVDNWVGFYQSANAGGVRYGYIQTDGNRMYFRKENGVNGGLAFDFNGALYTNGNGIHAQHGHIFNVAGNEFNWIPDGYNSTMWFNYETYNRQNNGTISEYICGNGRHGHANLRAAKVFNAVWNDFAEYREGTTTEPGRVVAATALSNKVTLTTERLQPCAHVISDTFGCSVGQSDTAKTPIGVGGRVLVFPYQPIENYHVGDCLCAAPNGTADIMTREEIMLYPDRIIGIVDEIPTYKVWKQTLSTDKEKGGSGKVETNTIVNGRIWIYVK